MTLFPERLDKDIPENDPVRVVDTLIEHLRIGSFEKLYNTYGASPYHPRMMLKVIIYGYMNNMYSCRKIERCVQRDIYFMWLAASQRPDFNTINRFRNRFKDEINNIFTEVVLVLAEKGFITLDVEYIDGTKIESKANRYTFVWRKSTEKNRARLIGKINALLLQVDEAIAQENIGSAPEDELLEITSTELREIAGRINAALEAEGKTASPEQKERQKEKRHQARSLAEHADKLDEYNAMLGILGGRNSYSKTDHDATFMRMKEDAMNNGQTKPGYNLQIGTENQFITDFGIFQSPGDPLTMIPFYTSFHDRYGKFPRVGVADSGYGSEENYAFMEDAGIEAYVKYNMFHKEVRMHYEPGPFDRQSLYYNEKDDYYVCPMGQHMTKVGMTTTTMSGGYVSKSVRYRAQRCGGCPLRGNCFKGSGERTIDVNHRLIGYRQKAKERLTSDKGVEYRGRRCIEPEATFGQIKYNSQYKRFRHTGKDKVTMDFAFMAIAHNIKKMGAVMKKKA